MTTTWEVGDKLQWQNTVGVVTKVGHTYVTVEWTQTGAGATWTKRHRPEWLERPAFYIAAGDGE